MTDRNLREFERADEDRKRTIESKVQALTLRAWPGAIRYTSLDERVLDATTPTPIISLHVPSGRWVLQARSNFEVTTVGAQTLNLSVTGISSGTNEPLELDDAPIVDWTTPTAGLHRGQLSDFGQILLKGAALLTVNLWSATSVEVTHRRVKLLAEPW